MYFHDLIDNLRRFLHQDRHPANRTGKAEAPGRNPRSTSAFTAEPLESRQLLTVTGFSLVDEAHPPTPGITVISQPTIFHDYLQNSWTGLVNGTAKIDGQTLTQEVAAIIQAAEHKLGLEGYNISSSFDATPVYNGAVQLTSSGATVELTFDAIGNQTTFTSTTNSILGSYADPTFHVTYNLSTTVDLSIPSNLVTGKVTVTSNSVVSSVTVTTKNVIVGLLGLLGVDDFPEAIAKDIIGYEAKLPGLAPTSYLSGELQTQAILGYRDLLIGLSSGGNLLLTAQRYYVATPVISPGPGSYSSPITVKISDATPGASIHYTTNGSTPTYSSPVYAGSFTVTTDQTVKALAFATDYAYTGTVASVTYAIPANAPGIAPLPGTHPGPLMVDISGKNYDTTIRYTTDGSTPTAASTLYTGPITLKKSATVKAVAFAPGYSMSAVSSAAYTLIPKGLLTGSQTKAASSYDLSTLGTTAWAHWGRKGVKGNFDHNAGGTQISNVSTISINYKDEFPASFGATTNSSRSVNWTGGTPTSTDAGDDGFIYAVGKYSGYSFVVPALTTTQTLYIYAGGIGASLSLEASLSDGSAPNFYIYPIDTAKTDTGVFTDLFKITFRAGTPGAALVISYTNTALYTTRADLIAAALT